MTLLTFNSKYIIQSQSMVQTTSVTLIDDTPATKTFTLSSSKTVLVIYQSNSIYGVGNSNYQGMQSNISIDGVDRARSDDSPWLQDFPIRNCTFWIGTLGTGSHTIKGRFASKGAGFNTTISNRILLIYILNGNEFQYIDDSITTQTTSSTTFVTSASVAFTPSGPCKALYLYNCSNSGATESVNGKRARLNVNGATFAQAEKAGYWIDFANSIFACNAGSLASTLTTVILEFAGNTATTVTINNRQLGVLLFDDSTLLDVVSSASLITTTSNSLVDDTLATPISRTIAESRELLVLAWGTKRYGTTTAGNDGSGEQYGIMTNSIDRQNSRGSTYPDYGANSAGTCWAETLNPGIHTIKGRFSNNIGTITAMINGRRVMALWLYPCPAMTCALTVA